MPRRSIPYFMLALVVCVQTAIAADQPKASKIIVYKGEYRMELLDKRANVLKTYDITLGGNPQGHKIQEGDERTPEGLYKISGRNPNSNFHLSLRVSYPNEQDIAQAKKRGVSPGGDIMIHGVGDGFGWMGSLHRVLNWTDGCIAVTNYEIEEIWNLVRDGTPIEIRP